MNRKRIWIVLAVFLCLVAFIVPGHAATLTVINGEVAVNNNGKCSLVEAFNNAEDTSTGQPHTDCAAGNPSGADTINLPTNGSFTLTTSVSTMNFSGNGLPLINTQITVNGNGSTIQRSGAAAAFRFLGINNSGNLTLNNLTLSGGRVVEDGGGAIFNWGGLTLEGVTLDGNNAEYGGAIQNAGGTINIRNSTLSNNSAITGISAGVGGAASGDGTMTIVGSTIVDNFATALGGGLHNGGTLNMTNSTVYSNWAQNGPGGGISNNSQATLTNVSLLDNTAGTNGGGLFNANFATATLHRSLLTANFANFSANEITNLSGSTVNANDYNVFGHSGAANVSGFTPGANDIVPSVARDSIRATTIANNGGPTQTVALVAGSPAIDAAPSAGCTSAPVNVDQRGQPRPVDGNGSSTTKECDAGAYEAQGVPVDPKLYVSVNKAGNVGGVGDAL